jgi:hypothetical protein
MPSTSYAEPLKSRQRTVVSLLQATISVCGSVETAGDVVPVKLVQVIYKQRQVREKIEDLHKQEAIFEQLLNCIRLGKNVIIITKPILHVR